MAKQKQNNGNKVFHRIAKEIRLDFMEANNRRPTLAEWNEIQKQASAEIYQPKFKGKPNNRVRKVDIITEVESLFQQPQFQQFFIPDSCYSVFDVDEAELAPFEWWLLEEKIRSFPVNLQVQIDAPDGGGTAIERISAIDNDDLKSIVDQIRLREENKSGLVYNIRRRKIDGAPDGQNCSYYLHFFLGDDLGLPEIEPLEDERELSPEELRTRAENLKKQREQRRKKTKARTRTRPEVKPEPKKKKKKGKKKPVKDAKAQRLEEFNKAVANIQQLLKDDLITKKQAKDLIKKAGDNLELGGIV